MYTQTWVAQYTTIVSIKYIRLAGMSEINLILCGYMNYLFTKIMNELIKIYY